MEGGQGNTGGGGWKGGSIPRFPFSILLLIGFIWLGASVVLADVTASLHMSTSPGGDEAPAVRSGTATVYAVLSYEDAAETRFEVLVYSSGGVVLFRHSDVYDGSGQRDIEITGRDIFAGYVSAAEEESGDLEEAIDIALQATSANAKRVRTASVVNVARSLDNVLAALEQYPLSLDQLDRLEEARDRAAEVDAQGTQVMSDVPDEDLDTELQTLRGLVTATVGAVDSALDGIDTNAERAWLDGAYTIQLKRNGQISVGFDWEVNPDGVPGATVAPSPTASAEPTETATPTETPEPTATATELPTTPTSGPTAVPTVSATQTPRPSPTARPTMAPTASLAPSPEGPDQTGPTALPPTATPVRTQTPAPAETGPPEPPTALIPPVTQDQTGSPAPPTAENVGPTPTPPVQVRSQDEVPLESESAGPSEELRRPDISRETPLAPQEVRELPVIRIVAMVSAIMLGLIALWLRARI